MDGPLLGTVSYTNIASSLSLVQTNTLLLPQNLSRSPPSAAMVMRMLEACVSGPWKRLEEGVRSIIVRLN